MRKFFLLFLFLPSLLLADAGTGKKTVLAPEKPPEVVEDEVEEVRYCGWSQHSFSHFEGGSNYNFGVSSVGSGVWGSVYVSPPTQKTVYVSEYGCSPKKYTEVIKTKGGADE